MKSKILIVDDDPKLSHLMAMILSRAGGYEVLEENRPFAALATARQFRPDAILLDVDMPGKDGGTLAREIGEDASLAKIPVMFVTSLVQADEAGARNGARYFSKPIDPKRLLETVGTLCPRLKREEQTA
jgi:twitching motility two-component system response regulator PilH